MVGPGTYVQYSNNFFRLLYNVYEAMVDSKVTLKLVWRIRNEFERIQIQPFIFTLLLFPLAPQSQVQNYGLRTIFYGFSCTTDLRRNPIKNHLYYYWT